MSPHPHYEPAPVILAEPETPFWGFGEILVVMALTIVGTFIVGTFAAALLHAKAQIGYWSVAEQFCVYSLTFLALKLLFFRYQKPLFRSLAWIPQPFSAAQLALSGIVLSLLVVVLQQFILRTPEIETPFEKLLADPASRIAIAIFGVTLAPIVEELLFRGFLQPVLVAAAGVFPGILLTSVLFGALHLAQNAGMWQSGFLITIVGFVLGVIRHVSGSTRASAITHVAYNSLPCAALILQGIPTHK